MKIVVCFFARHQSAIIKKMADVDFSDFTKMHCGLKSFKKLTSFEEQTEHNRLFSYLS